MSVFRPDWEAIASELPQLTIRSAVPVGEGWMSTAWRVNDELVFKFPKRPDVWPELDCEIAFLHYARSQLPVPVPEHLHQVRESAGARHGYVVMRNFPGRGIEPATLSAQERSVLARVLAGFLRALHDISPAPVASILPRHDEYAAALESRCFADTHVAPHLSRTQRSRLIHEYERHLGDPMNFDGNNRIVHADLACDHIFHIGQSITGVLDWGDVSLGDPDHDFGYFYEELGESFIRDMALHYGHTDPDRLVSKARHFVIANQVGTIVYGADYGLPGDVERSWETLRSLLSEGT